MDGGAGRPAHGPSKSLRAASSRSSTLEDLIAFLRSEKVEVRLYDKGFLHAKAYLFHQDEIGPGNRILKSERDASAKAVAPSVVDLVQRTVAEELKNAIRRGGVEREKAKAAIKYLAQPMARFAVTRLRKAYTAWSDSQEDAALLEAVLSLAEDFSKSNAPAAEETPLKREDLDLICLEYVTG